MPGAELEALTSPALASAVGGGSSRLPHRGCSHPLHVTACRRGKLSAPAMEKALPDVPVFPDFAGRSDWDAPLPSESNLLRLCHLLERCKLADYILVSVNALRQAQGLQRQAGSVVDTAWGAAPRPPELKRRARFREAPAQAGHPWDLGLQTHIGVNADSGRARTVRGSRGNAAGVSEAGSVLHGQEADVFSDVGHQGADTRSEVKPEGRGQAAMRRGRRWTRPGWSMHGSNGSGRAKVAFVPRRSALFQGDQAAVRIWLSRRYGSGDFE